MKINVLKEELEQSGVYKITNDINSKFYIGSTNCFRKRIKSHSCDLRKGKSGCYKLQNSVIKYGFINFTFSVIEICENYKEREFQLITELKPQLNLKTEISYNGKLVDKVSRKGTPSGFKGKKHTEESKLLMSQQRKGRVHKMKGKKHPNYNTVQVPKVVISTNTKTGEIIEHQSAKEASSYFKFGHSTIYQCCSGLRDNCHGIEFHYKT